MKNYMIVVKLPEKNDFKAIVFPNMLNMELNTETGSVRVKDNCMYGMFSATFPPTYEELFNMWLKFDCQFVVYDEDELKKASENPEYNPVPMVLVEGKALDNAKEATDI